MGVKVMSKVFLYEWKRLLLNKFTVGLFVITAFYSYWVMQGEIVIGIIKIASAMFLTVPKHTN